ncbi:MAG: lysoplasmalogenase [Chloroflexi bacterium]|nr:lysoplasmalogenase [Chloroflexota bacterium]
MEVGDWVNLQSLIPNLQTTTEVTPMLNYLETTPRTWLTALWALWAILLFGGFIFGSAGESHRMPTWTRLASSATLVAAGWSWFLVAPADDVKSYALFIALGMTLGFLGDLILAGALPGGRNVMGGIISFGIGHIFYIVGILRFANQTGLDDPARRWGALAMWLVIAAVAWYLVVFRGQEATVLHWAALPYALLLASTTGFATGLALQSSLFVGLAVGAALFLFSDLVLAGELFSGLKFRLIGDLIWLTYGPGQMLIVYSIGAALRFI